MVLGWGSKKAQVHHDDEDMSMEEILASIRKYVAEGTTERSAEPQSPADSPYRQEESTGRAKNRRAENSRHEEPVFAPKNSFEDSSLFAKATQEQKDFVEEYAVTRETIKNHPTASDDLIEQKVENVSQGNPFAKLAEVARKEAQSVTAQPTNNSNQTLDQLIGDLAKPMIQRWIDQNLPEIVECMVADEIAKMTGAK